MSRTKCSQHNLKRCQQLRSRTNRYTRLRAGTLIISLTLEIETCVICRWKENYKIYKNLLILTRTLTFEMSQTSRFRVCWCAWFKFGIKLLSLIRGQEWLVMRTNMDQDHNCWVISDESQGSPCQCWRLQVRIEYCTLSSCEKIGISIIYAAKINVA